MLDHIKKMNWWGSKNNGEEYENKLQFFNQNKKFDWDNNALSNNDELVEKAPMTHSILLAELLGIIEENDFSQELGMVNDSILAA